MPTTTRNLFLWERGGFGQLKEPNDGWTDDKDKEICQNEEYRDSDDCVGLPQDICTQKEVTIEVKQKKRECKDIAYADCSAKVPTETCVEDHVRVPTTFQQKIPFKVCGSDKWSYTPPPPKKIAMKK